MSCFMDSSCAIWIVLLCICVVKAQNGYFRLLIERNDPPVLLNCLDQVNNGLLDGNWLHNGSDYRNINSSGSCFFNANATGSSLTFNLLSECDGFFQCGNNLEYSAPIRIIAPLSRTPAFSSSDFHVKGIEGDSITLHCYIRVSAIASSQRLNWFRLDNNRHDVNVPHNLDYSITLTNLTMEQDGIYFCEVRQPDNPGSSPITGQRSVLTIIKYVKPKILGPSVVHDGGNIDVTIEGEGTDLQFKWFLNGNEITDNNYYNISITSQSHQSKLNFAYRNSMLNRNNASIITVRAHNTDETNNIIRNDTLTGWLFPIPVTTSPPSPIMMTEMPEIFTYIGSSIIAVLLLCVVILGTALAYVCCKKKLEKEPSILTKVEVEDVDRFFSTLMSGLLELERKEGIPSDVKWEIKQILNQVNDKRNDHQVGQPPPCRYASRQPPTPSRGIGTDGNNSHEEVVIDTSSSVTIHNDNNNELKINSILRLHLPQSYGILNSLNTN